MQEGSIFRRLDAIGVPHAVRIQTSRSVTMPSSLWTFARFTTGRISRWFAPIRSSARSSP